MLEAIPAKRHHLVAAPALDRSVPRRPDRVVRRRVSRGPVHHAIECTQTIGWIEQHPDQRTIHRSKEREGCAAARVRWLTAPALPRSAFPPTAFHVPGGTVAIA